MNYEVLLVDDDKMVLFLHKILVEKSELPPAPKIFSDGREVFDFLQKHEQESRHYLILLDLNMPGMSGWDFLNSIQEREISKKIFVCVVTSSINLEDKQKAENYKEVIAFVEKPLNKDLCNLLGKQVSEKIQS